MSQTVLAGLVGKTESWIEKIEAGRANLQMLPNIARLAEVLDISPFELMPDDIVQVDETTRGQSVPALRKQLLSYRFVNPRYLDADPRPLDLPDLTKAVAVAWAGYQASRFGFVISELHRLLPLALATVSATERSQREHLAVVQMAYLYQLASCVLTKVGEQDLAFICADRGEQLVQQTPDVAARMSVQRTIAHALFSNAQYDDALAVVEQTVALAPTNVQTPEILSALGTTHLVGAMVSGRSRNRSAAQQHLARARDAANRLGYDGNHLWTAFGPTNVAIHEVAIAAELGDFQVAASLGQRIEVSAVPLERQVRHRLEVARALHFRHQQGEALALVLQAELAAPEQVRRHFLTHSLLHEWVRSRRVMPGPELHGLARRSGVFAA